MTLPHWVSAIKIISWCEVYCDLLRFASLSLNNNSLGPKLSRCRCLGDLREVQKCCDWQLIPFYIFSSQRNVSKGKGVPRPAEVDQGVPGRLRSRIFLTFRHYKGDGSSVVSTGRLYPRRNPWYSLSEAESTSVLSGVPRKKSPVTQPGIDLGTIRLVAQRLNHYATPGPSQRNVPLENI